MMSIIYVGGGTLGVKQKQLYETIVYKEDNFISCVSKTDRQISLGYLTRL